MICISLNDLIIYSNYLKMPQKSKTAQQKASSIAIARAFCHSPPSSDAEMIISQQPDFVEQKSSVQEVVEEAGHLCIFLPKFHCELNFIEFFWGAVKKYLREHCDYSFETLKTNLPKALESVQISTIRKWNTGWFGGWRHTGRERVQRMHNLM